VRRTETTVYACPVDRLEEAQRGTYAPVIGFPASDVEPVDRESLAR
jgi:hypothetical protein